MIKKIIKYFFPNSIYNMMKKYKKRKTRKILYNVFDTNYNKNCLFVYIQAPFISGINDSHQNLWQAFEMARIINTLGYNVDVVDCDYDKDDLLNKYELLLDIYPIDDRFYKKSLSIKCKKIAYLTGSNPEFSMKEEAKRIERVIKSRNKVLPIVRGCDLISKDVEKFSAFMFIGSKYNLKTFSNFELPKIYFVPNTGYQIDVDGSRRSSHTFLFFASLGQVHKGLDLLLEVFSTVCKDCELYICSHFKEEPEFCKAYEYELYNFENIHAIGFLPLGSDLLNDIFEKCTYLIVPSCSEGMMGSALTCMSAGIIPMLTKECGYDEGEFIPIDDIDINAIGRLVHEYANKDSEWINAKSKDVKEIAQNKYSKKNFSKKVRSIFEEIING